MRGLEKNCMKRDKQTDGHCDSMKESAKGRFFENTWGDRAHTLSNTLNPYIRLFPIGGQGYLDNLFMMTHNKR